MLDKEVKRQIEILSEGVAEIIPEDEFKKKIKKSIEKNKPLRVKLGIDPTSPDIHIGHMVVFNKIRQFQDLGHTAVIIIGDYTARIGDPTDRDSERTHLTPEQVIKNKERYLEQIFKVLDKDKTEIHHQSEWFGDFDLHKTMTELSKFSVAQMLAHETFRKRIDDGKRLSLLEMFYPVLQAYDSVAINADIEMGGTDQKFNILCGRDLQRDSGLEPQVVCLMPLLLGTNGEKMSKTFNNYVGVLDPPEEKFGRIMSISDDLIMDYFLYTTAVHKDEREVISERLKNENPRNIKMLLGKEIVKIYDGEEAAEKAEKHFVNIFSKGEIPEDIEEVKLSEPQWICSFLTDNSLTKSNGEARRLIKQGAVKLNSEKLTDLDYEISGKEELVIKVGKRKFIKVIPE